MLKTRVATALVLAPAGIAAILWLPPVGFAVLAAFVFSVGAWEWTRMIPLTTNAARVCLPAAVAVAFILLWMHVPRAQLPLVAAAGAIWWFASLLWLAKPTLGGSTSVSARVFKAIACGLTLLPAWCALIWLRGLEQGAWWVLGLLVLVWMADILAYFSGKQFGRHKLAPSISPGKTREGAFGALAGAALYGAAVGNWAGTQFSWAQLAGLAVVTAAISIVGDLLISLLKRHSDLKDSGTIIPGHGGVLDRFDSTFAAAPVCVAGLSWLLI